ncbi:hypothetical protein, partial [Streptomyces subrutilus]|uniref:hypothetical protein n=1 Tax=Streptomyces subrutilus TaxID=36818 RepID=UPI00167857BB
MPAKGSGGWGGRLAEPERDLNGFVLDVVDGEPDQAPDWLGIEQEKCGGDPLHQREFVACHGLADQGDAPVLTDGGRVLGADRGYSQAGHRVVVHGPAQERLDDAAADGVFGIPGVQVGLGAVIDGVTTLGEPGQECGRLGEPGSGRSDRTRPEGPSAVGAAGRPFDVMGSHPDCTRRPVIRVGVMDIQ